MGLSQVPSSNQPEKVKLCVSPADMKWYVVHTRFDKGCVVYTASVFDASGRLTSSLIVQLARFPKVAYCSFEVVHFVYSRACGSNLLYIDFLWFVDMKPTLYYIQHYKSVT